MPVLPRVSLKKFTHNFSEILLIDKRGIKADGGWAIM